MKYLTGFDLSPKTVKPIIRKIKPLKERNKYKNDLAKG